MTKPLIQFYDDDIYGYIEFIDMKQNYHGVKALPKHIKIVSPIASVDKKLMRRAIAADINGR